MRHLVAMAAIIVAMSQMVGPAQANLKPSNVTRISTDGAFVGPVGFQIFCLTNASQCRGGGFSEIGVTDRLLTTLMATNSRVNRSISPQGESKDVWTLGASRGDCEDYVLQKRAELVRLGLPASALRIGLARTRGGEGHAVLIVRTSEGDLVLDNLTSKIKFWDQTGLQWVAMTASNGKSWQRIG